MLLLLLPTKLPQGTPRAENVGDHVRFSPNTSPEPAFRGPELSPDGDDLLPGRFLSTAPLLRSASLEVTGHGDMVFREGDLPAFPTRESPDWAHRAGAEGVLCKVKSWLGTQMHVSVRNGRWTVGRGRGCTLGESPKPSDGWLAYMPGNGRGKAMRNASLQITEDRKLVLASGDTVFWRSDDPPRPKRTNGKNRREVLKEEVQ